MELRTRTYNEIVITMAGIFFAIGWILIIDGHVAITVTDRPSPWLVFLPILSTLCYGLLTLVSVSILREDQFVWGDNSYTVPKLYLFGVLTILLGALAASATIYGIYHSGKVSNKLPTLLQPIGLFLITIG